MAHRLFSLLVVTLAVAAPVSADNPFADAAPERLIEYIQVDTINPPGNEINGANFFARYLKQAGIEYTIEESAPGRGNIWARLKGGNKPGLVLLNHMDVVPANEKYWSVDPYAGVVKDGFIYGRGALDMKGLGIAQFQAFLGLAASGKKLNRDVWFIATADEEAGGQYGAGWLAEAHPKIFRKVGYLLNEGGGGSRLGTDVRYTVEVTQKVPLWLRLKAVGRPGHGSSPQVQTAVTRLLRAGYRITTTPFEARAIEPVAAMFRGIADSQPPHFREYYRDIAAHVDNVDFMMQLQLANPSHHALLRNACSATILEGSAKINVVPAEAFLELDCRLLPDQDVDTFVNELSLIIADPNIQIERIMNFSPAISSHDTDLFRLITAQISEYYPGSSVIPGVSTGFTDSHFFRDLGITSYGFGPFLTEPVNYRGVHGNDEKIGIETLKEGTRLLQDIIETFATETR